MGVAKNTTPDTGWVQSDEIDSNLLAMHIYSLGEVDPMQSHAGLYLGTE